MIEIESKEHAIKVIRHVAEVFLVLGAIQIFIGFASENISSEVRIVTCVFGGIYVILGLLLGKLKNQIIPIILLLFSSTNVLLEIANLFGLFGNSQHKGIPIIGIAMIIASLQAIKATRKYSGMTQ